GRLVEVGPVADVIKNPLHPYTVGLMGSIPAVGHKVERLVQIDGAMPRLTEIPSGCAFHPRCPEAVERCRVERPDPEDKGDSQVACWLHWHEGDHDEGDHVPAHEPPPQEAGHD
ncbi:MAG: methionine ABC transporter ATP-binding protein, partial [Rhodobacterales bacterium]|nr:methionine ABC transporter ATP-binding protein [Rhodobacterales bacterium]